MTTFSYFGYNANDYAFECFQQDWAIDQLLNYLIVGYLIVVLANDLRFELSENGNWGPEWKIYKTLKCLCNAIHHS